MVCPNHSCDVFMCR